MQLKISADLRGLIEATVMTLLAVSVVILLRAAVPQFASIISSANVSVLFLIAIMGASLRGGVAAGIWSTTLGALANHLFYPTSPHFRIEAVIDAANIINLVLFILAGIIASLIGGAARKHLERIHESQDKRVLEVREKLRATMLSSLSHDLKTPLASVIGALDVYQQIGATLPEERKRDLMRTALNEANRLDGLITNILDMTKLETGAVHYRSDWHDPRSLVENVVRKFNTRMVGRPVTVESTKLAWEVDVDAGMLERAMIQVMDNALKYTPENTPVKILLSEDATGFSIAFIDQGKGIPAAEREAVFDKYTRLNQGDRKVAGAGLGLPIARLILKAHDGDLQLLHGEGGGARFEIHLPKSRARLMENETA